MAKRIILFGIGTMVLDKNSSFWEYMKQNKFDDKIVAYSDTRGKQNVEGFKNIPFITPDQISTIEFDKIIVGSITSSLKIKNYCLSVLKIPKNKIDSSFAEYPAKARIEFLKEFSKIVYDKNLSGSVAEGGVFEGDFAKILNENFSDRKLYLFDTFKSFDDKDLEIERSKHFSFIGKERFECSDSIEETIMNKMNCPENVQICKGYFPDTTKNINDNFIFANLDFDLYNPTLEGLNFFYPRMEKSGVILVHDFFNESYKGVKQAVTEFCNEKNLNYLPIGDKLSVMIVKS